MLMGIGPVVIADVDAHTLSKKLSKVHEFPYTSSYRAIDPQ